MSDCYVSRHNGIQISDFELYKKNIEEYNTEFRVTASAPMSGAYDMTGVQAGVMYEKYDHPLYKRLGALAKKMGGHGGMDFMMRYRIIECLKKGEPLDQNMYEGCFWRAVTPLSARSIEDGGAPQRFPDFTRGNWKTTNPLSIIS